MEPLNLRWILYGVFLSKINIPFTQFTLAYKNIPPVPVHDHINIPPSYVHENVRRHWDDIS
ncbi:MAG: hypothetical protein ABJF11_20625 [Reichenbachiella sp.]|uniref:hypothetical protein n=1 Tax=Reichenbachiella sp. TaxID=2184521 RepID=UPI00326356D5